MPVDLVLVEAGLEVGLPEAVALEQQQALGVEVDLVGGGGQVVGVAAVGVGRGDHLLAGLAEVGDRRTHVLKLAQAAALELVEVEEQGLDLVVLAGGADGVDHVAHQGLLPVGDRRVGEHFFPGIGRELLDQRALGAMTSAAFSGTRGASSARAAKRAMTRNRNSRLNTKRRDRSMARHTPRMKRITTFGFLPSIEVSRGRGGRTLPGWIGTPDPLPGSRCRVMILHFAPQSSLW